MEKKLYNEYVQELENKKHEEEVEEEENEQEEGRFFPDFRSFLR